LKKNLIQKISEKKSEFSKAQDPFIDEEKKEIYVPNSLSDEDYYAGNLILSLANKYKFKINLFKFDDVRNEKIDDYDDLAIGISMGCLDKQGDINLTPYQQRNRLELGRKYVRSQIVTQLAHKYKFMSCLKKKQFYFGNDPTATEIVNRKPVPVQHISDQVVHIFKENGLERKLLVILNRLIGYVPIENHILFRQLAKEFRSYGSICESKLTKVKYVKSKHKNKPDEVIKKTARLPNRSSLLTKGEYDLIISMIRPYFRDPFLRKGETSLSQEDLINLFCLIGAKEANSTKTSFNEKTFIKDDLQFVAKGYELVSKRLAELHSIREQTLQKFAQITTNRLKAIRKNTRDEQLRKSGVKPDQVHALLCEKETSTDELCNDLIRMNLEGIQFAAEYKQEVEKKNQSLATMSLSDWLKNEILLAQKSSLSEEKKEKFDYTRMTLEEQARFDKAAQAKELTSLQKAAVAELPLQNRESLNKIFTASKKIDNGLQMITNLYKQRNIPIANNAIPIIQLFMDDSPDLELEEIETLVNHVVHKLKKDKTYNRKKVLKAEDFQVYYNRIKPSLENFLYGNPSDSE
jgi:hypothetical protein